MRRVVLASLSVSFFLASVVPVFGVALDFRAYPAQKRGCASRRHKWRGTLNPGDCFQDRRLRPLGHPPAEESTSTRPPD
jgi:hypothetical protein